MLNEQTFSGIWGTAHIIYFVLTFILIVGSLILINRFMKKEKTIDLTIRITAMCLLTLLLINRVGYSIQYIIVTPRQGYGWFYILPETFCGISAMCLSLSILFFKKDNCVIHAFIYMSIVGALATLIYPDFLADQGLWEVGTMTSLLYHAVMLFLSLLVISKRHVELTMKKWYFQSLAYIVMICYGLFYWQVLAPNLDTTILGINIPVVRSEPILTSWWMIGIGYLLWELVFLFLYERFINKKTFKTIGDEFVHFYRYINN